MTLDEFIDFKISILFANFLIASALLPVFESNKPISP